jgi:hypothetical protein
MGPGSLQSQAAGRQHDLEGVTEQAAVNLTLTVFKIDPVERTIEIVHFAFFDGRYAQGAGDFLQLLKHGKPLFVYLPTLKIDEAELIHQSYKGAAAMQ